MKKINPLAPHRAPAPRNFLLPILDHITSAFLSIYIYIYGVSKSLMYTGQHGHGSNRLSRLRYFFFFLFLSCRFCYFSLLPFFVSFFFFLQEARGGEWSFFEEREKYGQDLRLQPRLKYHSKKKKRSPKNEKCNISNSNASRETS